MHGSGDCVRVVGTRKLLFVGLSTWLVCRQTGDRPIRATATQRLAVPPRQRGTLPISPDNGPSGCALWAGDGGTGNGSYSPEKGRIGLQLSSHCECSTGSKRTLYL